MCTVTIQAASSCATTRPPSQPWKPVSSTAATTGQRMRGTVAMAAPRRDGRREDHEADDHAEQPVQVLGPHQRRVELRRVELGRQSGRRGRRNPRAETARPVGAAETGPRRPHQAADADEQIGDGGRGNGQALKRRERDIAPGRAIWYTAGRPDRAGPGPDRICAPAPRRGRLDRRLRAILRSGLRIAATMAGARRCRPAPSPDITSPARRRSRSPPSTVGGVATLHEVRDAGVAAVPARARPHRRLRAAAVQVGRSVHRPGALDAHRPVAGGGAAALRRAVRRRRERDAMTTAVLLRRSGVPSVAAAVRASR